MPKVLLQGALLSQNTRGQGQGLRRTQKVKSGACQMQREMLKPWTDYVLKTFSSSLPMIQQSTGHGGLKN